MLTPEGNSPCNNNNIKRKAQMKLSKLFDHFAISVERKLNRRKNSNKFVHDGTWFVRAECTHPSENTDGEIEPCDLVLRHTFRSLEAATKVATKVWLKGEINSELWSDIEWARRWREGGAFKHEAVLFSA